MKGYAARELYLRHLEEDAKAVEVIRKNARQELGISPDREEPSLLRSYLEQRIAVSDHKTMGQVGYMMAWGWEQAANTGNEQMLAFCGRMMTYVEQACLDGGKTQLAWLLTGLTEPNYQQLAVNRRKSTLSPFARLPAATWVAANVSYLKDNPPSSAGTEQSATKSGQGPGRRSESQTCAQKEAGKGGERLLRTCSRFLGNSQGTPEQCSRGICVYTNNIGTKVDNESSDESKFFNCNFDWSKSSCHVENFAIIQETLKLLEQVPCGFNVFRKLALVPAWLSRPVAASAPRSSLWPVPPPLWSWTVNNSPNPKRRKRLRQLRLKHQMLQNVVCMLNWIALGYPKAPPSRAQAGEPTTFDQDRVLETLQGHINHFCDLGPIARADLGPLR